MDTVWSSTVPQGRLEHYYVEQTYLSWSIGNSSSYYYMYMRLISGVNTLYMLFCFLKQFFMVSIELKYITGLGACIERAVNGA